MDLNIKIKARLMWVLYLAMVLVPCAVGVLIWQVLYYKGESIEVHDDRTD